MQKNTLPKLAICLQICPMDMFTGLRLAHLIAKIEPEKRRDIEFIVSARRDTNPVTVSEIASKAAEKFANVRVIKCKRFGTGWPMGCNDLWQETMMRVSQMKDAGQIQSPGVLTFEADCLPLRSDWLDRLAQAWSEASHAGKLVCGHAHSWDKPAASIGGEEVKDPPTHINGNAIFSPSVSDRHPQLNGCDARSGWDAFHGDLLLSIGVDTPFIFQRYRLKDGKDHVRNEPINRAYIHAIRKNGEIPALFHGIKGDYGLAVIEAMVADGTFYTR